MCSDRACFSVVVFDGVKKQYAEAMRRDDVKAIVFTGSSQFMLFWIFSFFGLICYNYVLLESHIIKCCCRVV